MPNGSALGSRPVGPGLKSREKPLFFFNRSWVVVSCPELARVGRLIPISLFCPKSLFVQGAIYWLPFPGIPVSAPKNPDRLPSCCPPLHP